GPVPSRRLGHSLGINNIPPKNCSYSCIYCQLGRTEKTRIERGTFYNIEDIVKAVEKKVKILQNRNEIIDYLTFVPDGEPTLDINLGKEIQILKKLKIKIAIITNSSLIWDSSVIRDLILADWVSLKIDAITEQVWRRINRPNKNLQHETILEGMLKFADAFKGKLVTETMLIKDINDNINEINKIANFLKELKPEISYISIPIRPPAEKWAISANEDSLNKIYQIIHEKSIAVEYLIGYEGNAFTLTGNIEEDLLSITSVHPMREDAIREFLKKGKSNWSIIENLLRENKIIKLKYQSNYFYMRNLKDITK
ncbi:MAG: radical SAM protein, partial [Promethearchaeota archaeon]